ncbi:hypothetical protein KCU71_g43, partial [Aureobasidium melanogenum]
MATRRQLQYLPLQHVRAALCLFSVIMYSLYKKPAPTAPPGPSTTMAIAPAVRRVIQLFVIIPAALASQAKYSSQRGGMNISQGLRSQITTEMVAGIPIVYLISLLRQY